MKIKNNKMDWAMEGISLVMLVGMTLFLIVNWKNIPEQVPMHYDWAGNIDRWGSKNELFLLPIMDWGMYLLISGFECFPKIWNTGVSVTEENVGRVYRALKYMMKSLKVIVILDFLVMTLCAAMSLPLPGWFLPVVLILTFGDIIFWIVQLVRVK